MGVARKLSMSLDRIADLNGPDFLPYYSFVDLSLVARWSKTKFLTGKFKFLDPSLFDRFLES